MNRAEIVAALDAEIDQLTAARNLLDSTPEADEPRLGRSTGSAKNAKSSDPQEPALERRTVSAEGKARIAAAQKKRWAAKRRHASTVAFKPQGKPIRRTAIAAKTADRPRSGPLPKKASTKKEGRPQLATVEAQISEA